MGESSNKATSTGQGSLGAKGLEAVERSNKSDIRADILNRGVAALITINGGAAVAVLAFTGNAGQGQSGLAIAMLDGLIFYAWGVVAAALVYFVRFARAFFTDSLARSPSADLYTAIWALLAFASLVFFLAGTLEISSNGKTAIKNDRVEMGTGSTDTPPIQH